MTPQEMRAWVAESRAAQGLPPNPPAAVLARIVALLGGRRAVKP